jgi:hypothetical protein
MVMSDQLRKRIKEGWSKSDIAKLEQAWANNVPSSELAAMFGYSCSETFMNAARALRHIRQANLPPRPRGPRRSPVTKAAEARGISAGLMHRRIIEALNEEGVGFIDNVLDDGVTTPGGEA